MRDALKQSPVTNSTTPTSNYYTYPAKYYPSLKSRSLDQQPIINLQSIPLLLLFTIASRGKY